MDDQPDDQLTGSWGNPLMSTKSRTVNYLSGWPNLIKCGRCLQYRPDAALRLAGESLCRCLARVFERMRLMHQRQPLAMICGPLFVGPGEFSNDGTCPLSASSAAFGSVWLTKSSRSTMVVGAASWRSAPV